MATCVCAWLASGAVWLLAWLDANQPSLGFSPTQMLAHMGWVALSVVVVLLLMSIYSIAVMLERYLTFKAAANQSRQFAPRVAEVLRGEQVSARLDEALKLSQRYRRSHLAVVVNSGLQEFATLRQAQKLLKPERQLRKTKRAVRRAAALKSAELQRGLSSLATVGSTAPFVGLFGTVTGIIDAFRAMNEQQTAGFSAVSAGISEALLTTAFGLLVAIPAVWMFNYFSTRVRGFEIEMHNSADELIDFFLGQQESH
jgi:biopolymer transport protein ExbB/biopolymer transport protein TolQ